MVESLELGLTIRSLSFSEFGLNPTNCSGPHWNLELFAISCPKCIFRC